MLTLRVRDAGRLLVPALMLVLVGCFPTSSEKKQDVDESAAVKVEPTKSTASGQAEEGCCCCEEEKAADKVELKTVKYDKLNEAIRSHRGKVVVVDVWASWCLPCKQEFPHLVALHRKYAADGLVCLSVSVDEEKTAAKALEFLQKQKATFGNYRLDEETDFWQEKWDLKGIPAVFVFDRDGRSWP